MPSLREWLTELGILYVPRAGWGARAPKYRNPLPQPPDGVVWHHTVTAPVPEVAQMQAVQAFHMDGRGWSDFAYNLAVGQSGTVYEGRSAEGLPYGMLARSGGTGDPEDAHLFSVVSIGNFHTVDWPSDALLNSLGAVAGWMASEFGFTDQFRDRDFNTTACCGDRLAALVPFPTTSPTDPTKDWFDMATEAELQAVIAAEIAKVIKNTDDEAKTIRTQVSKLADTIDRIDRRVDRSNDELEGRDTSPDHPSIRKLVLRGFKGLGVDLP